MAYAAVASLLQTLEYLLQFPCMILEFKILQAKTFCNEFYPFLRYFQPTSNFSKAWLERLEEDVEPQRTYQFEIFGLQIDLRRLKENIEPLSLPIAECVETTFKYTIVLGILEITGRIFGIYHGTPVMSEKMFEILKQVSQISVLIEFIAEPLKTFLDKVNFSGSCWEVVLGILLHSQSLMQEITFFHEVIMQTMFFCENFRFFLSFLEDSSGKFYDPQVVRTLKNVVDRAGNFVEDCMVDNPIESDIKYFLDKLINSGAYPSKKEINLEKRVKDIFDGEKGICQYLIQALEEIHLLKGEIRKINDKTSSLQEASDSLHKGLLRQNSKQNIVVGLDEETIKIMEGLTRLPSRLEIVTIVGMGGIGKATLARQIFHHPFIDYHFHCRAWVIVSQVYSVRNLLLSLLGSVAKPTDEMFKNSNAQLAERLYRSLQGKRYLIIMDDVWSNSAWNDIKRCFPNEKTGSRIIVTSRFTELAIHTNPKNPPHCMNLLDSGQSWELLEKLVFGQEVCPPQLANVGKEIARKCKGLPLAIVVVAGVLSQIRTHAWWKKIAYCVRSTVCNDLEQCLDILALSYEYLPHHLKACFLYMGAFPEDCEIEAQKIIQIWIAEGLIHPRSSKNLEEIAEGFLEDLIDRSLIMVGKRSSTGKVKTCRLHDLLRELCLREARKENFMSVLTGEDQCFPPDASNQRRLSFQLNSDGDVHLAPPYPHLRSFLCFTLGSDFVPDIFFSSLNFKLLKVLDIFFLHFDFFPTQIVELANLRYLALKVSFELAPSITKLGNLQTLIINGPWNSRKDEKIHTLPLEC